MKNQIFAITVFVAAISARSLYVPRDQSTGQGDGEVTTGGASTGVSHTNTNVTQIANGTTPQVNSSSNGGSFDLINSCPTGNLHKIRSTDTFVSISQNTNVSTSVFLNINGLLSNGSNLPSEGNVVCLPYSCDIYTVKDGDTCKSIAATIGVPETAFRTYNPDLDSECNITPGYNVCTSLPLSCPSSPGQDQSEAQESSDSTSDETADADGNSLKARDDGVTD